MKNLCDTCSKYDVSCPIDSVYPIDTCIEFKEKKEINSMKKSEYTEKLIAKTKELDIEKLASYILDDPKFDIWSGSSKPEQHHYGKNGLAKHTCEVVDLCFSTMETLKMQVDPVEIFLSAIYHDAGKMYDYKPIDPYYRSWKGTEHKRLIHHISRSAIIWTKACMTVKLLEYEKARIYEDAVLHNILSHHCRREWGSPVMPKTRAAWLIHLCDTISGRNDDCDKIDFVKTLI